PHTGQNEQNTDIPTSHPALIHGSTSSARFQVQFIKQAELTSHLPHTTNKRIILSTHFAHQFSVPKLQNRHNITVTYYYNTTYILPDSFPKTLLAHRLRYSLPTPNQVINGN
ncbi:MAG: hypothetical protein ACI8P0_005392, partial [Planctomycetaceae bacterium]